MFKHIINEDVELVLLDINHAEEMFRSIDSCREHLRRYLPWVDDTKSPHDTRKFIESCKSKNALNNGFDAGIWYKGEFAGVIGFHSMNRSIKEVSIGYWLDEKFTGKGIMTEACRVFVDYAFDIYKLNRVEIRCAIDNEKSRAIPERLGFVQEGILRDGNFSNNTFSDCVVYSMLERDWNNENTCPLCGKDNNCQHGKSDCWCTTVMVPKHVLDLVQEDKKGRACICKECIEKYS